MIIAEHVPVSEHYYFVCKTKCVCGICLWAVLTLVTMCCKIQQLMQTCPRLATKNRNKVMRKEKGGYEQCVWLCMSWCVSIKWLTDRQKIDGNHCNFFAILLFSEHVCVLRNMPKITSSNHQPPMMLFFFLSLPCAGNLTCVVVCSS